jgi:hypothetical protein
MESSLEIKKGKENGFLKAIFFFQKGMKYFSLNVNILNCMF